MNVIDDQLARLVDVLEPILPGRVSPTPSGSSVSPAIWVELPSLAPNRVQGASAWFVDFPVWISCDGTEAAQVAGLNDIVAKAIEACVRLRNCWPVGVRPGEAGDWRTQVLTVRMTIAARSFCQPDAPTEAPIPPLPVAS